MKTKISQEVIENSGLLTQEDISDATNSTSTSTIASSKAVKSAYDLANTAKTAADKAQSGSDNSVKLTGNQTIAGTKTFSSNIGGNITGNAASATKLATARTIAISGGATGTATSFNGTENITIPVTALDVSKATAGILPIARGGTGVSSNPSMLVNLASTTADTVLEATPRPGVTGILPIANGGTGSSTKNFVDLSSAQTVAGVKTFTGNMNITKSAAVLTLQSPSVDLTTESTTTQYIGAIGFADKSTDRSGVLRSGIDANDSTFITMTVDDPDGSGSAYIAIYYPRGGTPYTSAPTPAVTDKSGKIATTNYVYNKLNNTDGGLKIESDGKVAVDFSQMPTDKFEALLKSIRVPIWLTKNTNFYVNGSTGSDTLDEGRGLSSSKPFKTIQACVNYICDNYNLSRYNAYINVAPGTYTGTISLSDYTATSGVILIRSSDTTNQAIISYVGGGASVVSVQYRTFYFDDVKFNYTYTNTTNPSTGSYPSIINGGNRGVIILRRCTFVFRTDVPSGTSLSRLFLRIFEVNGGGIIQLLSGSIDVDTGNLTPAYLNIFFSETLGSEISFAGSNTSQEACTTTLNVNSIENKTTVATSSSNASIRKTGGTNYSAKITGSATGKRYGVTGGATIQVGSATFFPGTLDGTVETSTYSWYK